MRPRTLTGVWGVFVFGLATIAVHPRVPPMSEIEAITPKTLGPVAGEGFECNGDLSPIVRLEVIEKRTHHAFTDNPTRTDCHSVLRICRLESGGDESWE